MRLTIIIALALSPSAVSAASEGFACRDDLTTCLTACARSTTMSRSECLDEMRRALPPTVESTPLQPRSRSKYAPVPQSGSSQQPGPYVNPQ